MRYKPVIISKNNGGFRKIYNISDDDKQNLRQFLPELEKIFNKTEKHRINFAFLKGKNCALNAFQHIGKRYTLSFDLCDFFDSVKRHHVEKFIPAHILDQCLIDDSPRQGLPTSPLIANIALVPFDEKVVHALRNLGIAAKYTRYADDLTFSFDDENDKGKIKTLVVQIADLYGFRVNAKKTRFQDSRNGRIIINNIGVDNFGLHATRKTNRKMRAAAHQKNKNSLRGLEEFSKCKLPKAIFDK